MCNYADTGQCYLPLSFFTSSWLHFGKTNWLASRNVGDISWWHGIPRKWNQWDVAATSLLNQHSTSWHWFLRISCRETPNCHTEADKALSKTLFLNKRLLFRMIDCWLKLLATQIRSQSSARRRWQSVRLQTYALISVTSLWSHVRNTVLFCPPQGFIPHREPEPAWYCWLAQIIIAIIISSSCIASGKQHSCTMWNLVCSYTSIKYLKKVKNESASSNVLFYPKPKDLPFTVTAE